MLDRRKTCIHIDDDEDDQLIFSTVLNMHFKNYELQSFSNCDEAKDFISTNPTTIKAFYIDLNMPKSNGIDCLQYLRGKIEFSQTPIIIYSTSNNPEDAKNCIEHGATDFLIKPSRVSEWVKKLSKHLDN